MTRKTDVLVVGAGPTGLVLALWLARAGINCRIIDKAEAAASTSRAMVVQARTLELYRQVGLAERCVAAGAPIRTIRLRVGGKSVAEVDFGAIGKGLSPFPFALSLPQDVHEKLLEAALADAGIRVERQITFAGLVQSADCVITRVVDAAGSVEQVRSSYIVGCDGYHSSVRAALGIAMMGGTYSQRFFVADVAVSSDAPTGSIVAALGKDNFHALFSLPEPHRARLIGTLQGDGEAGDEAQAALVVRGAEASLGIAAEASVRPSIYRVHHRVADSFACGRVFLAGDAAHVHSPAGGQGMNTGIGDAINLAWKLTCVIRKGTAPALLDTYEEERRPLALKLVRTTDRAFAAAVSPHRVASAIRLRILPHLWPILLRIPPVRRMIFRLISQTAITYRGGRLTSGRVAGIRGGDRLPWCPSPDNYAPIEAGRWHIQIYRSAYSDKVDRGEWCSLASSLKLPAYTFVLGETVRSAGIAQGLYLMRPDGHVAAASSNAAGMARQIAKLQIMAV